LNDFDNECFESIFIELDDTLIGKRIVGAVYRPPGHKLPVDVFLSSFDSVLAIISQCKPNCLIAGDYNIDLLKAETHFDTESFINNLYAHLFKPVITRPTHFTTSSSTPIDNILTNKPHDSLLSGILISDVSDNLPIFYMSHDIIKDKILVHKWLWRH
jgi:hypothetical protein